MQENSIEIAQGSILGPLLFIIFVNDLSLVLNSPQQHIVSYADDTNLIIGCKTLQHLIEKSQEFFDIVTEWYNKNRLILNKDKTNLILFRTKQSKVIKPKDIKLDTKEVKFSDNAKFLGVYINEHLDWAHPIDNLVKKLNSICYGIRIVNKYMNEETLRIMYFANFESVLKYGIIFWGGDGKIQDIFIVQKRLILLG